MTITIPDKMWKRFVEAVNGDDYCFLCDNHPSHGHSKDCPLYVAPKDGDEA